ncbi:hypothetical protein [Actinacidiphila acidipaludis]|uniref:Uncharacterized protein n=1 Tax=Actinacidiphila acidipaludis TaxID=2873382 RepID=A0ABS7QGV2_9ACTN|nr:hypothetical protein [Streptomyces acidipaludis]MBY8882399.1 hypothetical protein [Streptomyces acidipaludis]
MEQTGTSSRLTEAVQSLAADVVSALRSGDRSGVLCATAGPGADGDVALAAIRVLASDALLPQVLAAGPADPADLDVFGRAVRAFPPAPHSSPASCWSHWGMTRTLAALSRPHLPDLPGGPGTAGEPAARAGHRPGAGTEPDGAWLDDGMSWQDLTRRLAVLAPLAVPGSGCAPARTAAARTLDLARGFVRAVRRRDWLQAAGAARWLALAPDVPASLGLAGGLDFVQYMGGQDTRVLLHTDAARLMLTGAAV